MTLANRIQRIDWNVLSNELDAEAFALTPALLKATQRRTLGKSYDHNNCFRSTVNMAQHNFGRGQYRYFSYPLPPLVQQLRKTLYPPLASIANRWAKRLGQETRWPDSLDVFLERCHAAGQHRPTPLLLRYGPDDYNCLHQDLYGELYFPLQVIVQLSEPGADFDGGELLLVEQRPRMQSRGAVLSVPAGAAAIIPVRERPRQGARGVHRTQIRHGVSRIRSGQRTTLGIIFHDAT